MQVVGEFDSVLACKVEMEDRRRPAVVLEMFTAGTNQQEERKRLEAQRIQRISDEAERKVQKAIGLRQILEKVSLSQKMVGFQCSHLRHDLLLSSGTITSTVSINCICLQLCGHKVLETLLYFESIFSEEVLTSSDAICAKINHRFPYIVDTACLCRHFGNDKVPSLSQCLALCENGMKNIDLRSQLCHHHIVSSPSITLNTHFFNTFQHKPLHILFSSHHLPNPHCVQSPHCTSSHSSCVHVCR